jgi:hypothetical protein
MLRKGKHSNKHLQSAFKIDKEENFKFEIIKYIEKIEDKRLLREELLKWENLELVNYKDEEGNIDHNRCYNFLPTAGNNLGYRHTEETKKKISIKSIGKKHSKDSIDKIIESRKWYSHSEKTKEKRK